MKGGDLVSYVNNYGHENDIKRIRNIAKQILNGL